MNQKTCDGAWHVALIVGHVHQNSFSFRLFCFWFVQHYFWCQWVFSLKTEFKFFSLPKFLYSFIYFQPIFRSIWSFPAFYFSDIFQNSQGFFKEKNSHVWIVHIGKVFFTLGDILVRKVTVKKNFPTISKQAPLICVSKYLILPYWYQTY